MLLASPAGSLFTDFQKSYVFQKVTIFQIFSEIRWKSKKWRFKYDCWRSLAATKPTQRCFCIQCTLRLGSITAPSVKTLYRYMTVYGGTCQKINFKIPMCSILPMTKQIGNFSKIFLIMELYQIWMIFDTRKLQKDNISQNFLFELKTSLTEKIGKLFF